MLRNIFDPIQEKQHMEDSKSRGLRENYKEPDIIVMSRCSRLRWL
jgi:hypothetical protein